MTTSMATVSSDGTRWKAMDVNTQAWYIRNAEHHHQETHEQANGSLLTSQYATIPDEDAMTDSMLEHMFDWYRSRPDPQPVVIYLMSGEPPLTLDPKMLARGASPNWKAHWMWCNLYHYREASSECREVDIRLVRDFKSFDPLDDGQASVTEGTCYIVAFKDQSPVGQCVLNITTSPLGLAGVFDMAVEPDHQRHGIGTALSRYCCSLAKGLGIRYMFLNATEAGEKVYRKVGFDTVANGWTWHLPVAFSEKEKPREEVVSFLEALLLGRVKDLGLLSQNLSNDDLQKKTTNGLTPLELAAHFEQAESARWLIDRGVEPDIMSLWHLGWQHEAEKLIESFPERANTIGGQYASTPLHAAVERDDVKLLKLLLASSADVQIVDGTFGSSPLQWAEHLGREEMADLIRSKAV